MRLFSRLTTNTKPAKISMTTLAARTFVHRFHVPNCDRGTVHTFGNTHRVETPFDANPARLQQGFDQAERAVKSGANEGTRLYAAVLDTLDYFLQHADRRYAWVPIFVTDGMDNQSKVADFDPRWSDKEQQLRDPDLYRHCDEPKKKANVYAACYAGEAIARGLKKLRDLGIVCCPVVLGVGNNQQIDEPAIAALGHVGGFPAYRVGSFERLAALIEAEVTKVVVTDHFVGGQVGGYDVLATQRTARLKRFPVEYAIVIDRSGSMNDPE